MTPRIASLAVAVLTFQATPAPVNNAAPASVGPAVGYFEASADIGSPAIAGSTTYDAASQTYTLSAGGANMWFARDEFQFAWRRMSGDFTVRTHVKFEGAGVDPHRKIGVIIRKGLEADAPYVDAVRHGDGLTSLQRREISGGPTTTTRAAITHADVLELKREGRRYTMGVAKFGEPMVYTELLRPRPRRRCPRRPVRLLAQPGREGDRGLQQRPDRRAARRPGGCRIATTSAATSR